MLTNQEMTLNKQSNKIEILKEEQKDNNEEIKRLKNQKEELMVKFQDLRAFCKSEQDKNTQQKKEIEAWQDKKTLYNT